ncbi:hypothetical protein DMN91_003630 [Ooceraea biroi]|uniref:Uncharacterized protein n=1 Tax=Ooceraea biroi TaxID=2015173 RepID=A0A3L8DSX1_OOCBI|nr:hypothetical protein DMN91_003630 [Ooceraea biroi]
MLLLLQAQEEEKWKAEMTVRYLWSRGGGAVRGTGKPGGAGGVDDSGDPEREAVTLLRVGSRSASRDSVLHTTVTMTPTPTPPPLSN